MFNVRRIKKYNERLAFIWKSRKIVTLDKLSDTETPLRNQT